MKIILYIFLVFLCVFALFGLLICIEYLKYYKRKIVLKLRDKLDKEVKK